MLLCSIAANAHDFEVDGIYYGIMSYGPNKVFVTSWGNLSPSPAYSGAITIPSTVEYNGETYSVTSIGEKAFYNCDGLTDITIPNSVTSIQKDAFCRCTNLTSITIPNSVTSIGECAFQACESLTSVTIPESVTTLGDQAFHSCSNLTSVTIESQAVASMSHLWPKFGGEVTTYIFGDNITSIGISAFSGCTELTSVTIPNSVTSIGRDAFQYCI